MFITTSGYTREARDFAETVSDHVVIVDGARIAYEQRLHDQIECTHLATFLPALRHEFARRAQPGPV